MRWKELTTCVGRTRLQQSVANGDVIAVAGIYSLPDVARGIAVAHRLRGVQSHLSAAACWGLSLPPGPDVVDVTIPRKAKRAAIPGVALHYRDLAAPDVVGGMTSALHTVIDCLRDTSLRDALSVGDSALRSGLVTPSDLLTRASTLRGPGSALVRKRCGLLDARSENAFESCCRAILIDGGIKGFVPQLTIRHNGRFLGRVDLGNFALRVLLECESFAWHGDQSALMRDCRRYTELEAAGWRVLRMTWAAVMFDPEWVLARVQDAVSLAGRR